MLTLIRPWIRLAAVCAGTILFGIVAYQLVEWLRPAWVSGSIEGGLGWPARRSAIHPWTGRISAMSGSCS